MKRLLNGELCVWVVPAKDGKVSKLRISYLRIMLAAALLVASGAGLALLVGDYARMQLASLRDRFYFNSVKQERDDLLVRRDALSAELGYLRERASQAAQYQDDVNARLEQLASVIKSTTSVGQIDDSKSLASSDKKKSATKGIGGAELNCFAGGRLGTGCGLSGVERTLLGGVDLGSRSPSTSFEIPETDNLVTKLDSLLAEVRELPLGSPAEGGITSGFGFRYSPFSRELSMHEGLDIDLEPGDPIYATANGIVKEAKTCPTYGLMVDIEHSNAKGGATVVTRYAHLSSISVKAGQKISRGMQLGKGGSTGRSTGPHLHYEVIINGKALNPMPFIQLSQVLAKMVS